jgi:hypothetical protein
LVVRWVVVLVYKVDDGLTVLLRDHQERGWEFKGFTRDLRAPIVKDEANACCYYEGALRVKVYVTIGVLV